ncbi:hypothetical protein OF83DRAFT_1153273 [Amylostereum chailletii]|nr:hypothetical protein OF83DRAFT_1153273 [Amylostereum chailletii]
MDIFNMYEEVADMGISLISDIRPANLLAAPPDSHEQPRLKSPYAKTDRLHDFRIIDFDLATKSDRSTYAICQNSFPYVQGLFEDADPEGPTVEIPFPKPVWEDL